MKSLLRWIFIYLPATVLGLVGVLALTIWLGRLASWEDLEFLAQVYEDEGAGAVFSIVRTELFGVDESLTADPSFGRLPVAGRGHTPWVLRGNLDGRVRSLKLAMAPNLWAAYQLESATLYQVWEGEVLFEGSVYDYRHGPQPVSAGRWFVRNEQPVQWFLRVRGEDRPAEVRYLGHDYSLGSEEVVIRYLLRSGRRQVEIHERPALVERGGERYFQRRFEKFSGNTRLPVGFVTAAGQRRLLGESIEYPLLGARDIPDYRNADHGREADEADVSAGAEVIANSDCLSCHNEAHRVVGPAWSEVAQRYRGKLQEEVIGALVTSVRKGGGGKWGPVLMTPHPDLTEQQLRDAVTYILTVEPPEEDLDVPLDARGEPFLATRDYDVLPRPDSLHPAFTLENLAPPGFEPKVGGLRFRPDGKLLVVSWDADGAVFLLDPKAPMDSRVKRIAEGLQEPLGIAVLGDRIFVLQKQELTELIDLDGDDVIDRYRAHSYDWQANPNFHSFAFGLLASEEKFYFLTSICVLPGGASCPEQLPDQGKLLEVDMAGKARVFASGFRTPNGIAAGPDDAIYVTDNQGDWLPSSKLLRIERGGFYGSRAVPDQGGIGKEALPPVVWLPQDEVGNSPSEPSLLQEGPYAGQMIHGDVYNGGIKRVFTEEVEGQVQGAVFHFSSGFMGSVNRLVRGADDAIYVGELGNPPNWGEYGKQWYGLERLTYKGQPAFEVLAVRAREDGFSLELTGPLAEGIEPEVADLVVKQWFYHPTVQYGGPKYDETQLQAASLSLSEDRRTLRAVIPGLRAGYVIYLRLPEHYRSASGKRLWTREAWYTLNRIPGGAPLVAGTVGPDHWRDIFNGRDLDGWRNYRGGVDRVRKWVVEDGVLSLRQDESLIGGLLRGGSTDLIYYREKFRNFELSLEWKISDNGNSGIFYLVDGEQADAPWMTGLEMQVLDNDGHRDGNIVTHRAGDLYDLVSASPENVRPVGEWNAVRIRVQDDQIEHWLNGEKVVSIVRGSEEWQRLLAESKFADMANFGTAEAGYIVLQDHSDPVWYRNIRVRRLD